MKKWMLIGLLSLQCLSAQSFRITYQKSSNGTIIPNQDPVVVLATPHLTLISSVQMLQQKASFPREETFVDRKRNALVQKAQLNAQRFVVSVDSVSLEKQQFEFTSETKTILGYVCKKAVTSINSNTLELWYTDALGVKGSPTVLGQNLGMVLEIVRNGNFVTTALSVEKEKQKTAVVLPDTKNGVDLLSYRDLVWKSRFITLPVFEKEIINFSDQAKSNDSILRFANGTIAVRKITFPVITPGSKVFIDLIEQSNGDAYDRTGSVFLIPTDKANTFWNGLTQGANALPLYENGNGKKYQGVVATNSYSPLVELMRFFTPFGISHFNHISLKDKTWYTQVPYRQDISELAAAFSGKEVYLGVFIGNYDKGGHRISMNITLHPEEQSSAASPLVMPLFNTVNVMEMAGQEYGTMFNHEKGLEVTFTLTQDVRGARLRYLTTGHGGWENGDEFVPKKNTLLLDGKEIFSIVPWREDCGSYRLFNPASGNFPNGLSSSDYSRSNWCPGMVTYPYYVDLGDLKAGTHTLQVKIPQGAPEGSSFSAWNVSGVLLGH